MDPCATPVERMYNDKSLLPENGKRDKIKLNVQNVLFFVNYHFNISMETMSYLLSGFYDE